MGQECVAVCHWQGRSSEGRAFLEGDHLLFRGADFRLKLPFADMRALVACNGRLSITLDTGTAGLDLGTKAEDWANRIRNPKGLLDKLGLKPGMAPVLAGAAPDPALLEALDKAGLPTALAATAPPGSALVLLTAADAADLGRVPAAAEALADDGALWVLYPKGRKDLSQEMVFAAGKGAGLVDNKVCAVSATTTALRFVRPKARRGAA